MAVIGQQLTSPESGWKRYDDTHPVFKYSEGWTRSNDVSSFSSTVTYSGQIGSAELNFKFKGTKLRYIGRIWDTVYSQNIEVIVDGISKGFFSQMGSTRSYQILHFELLGLSDEIHTVRVRKTDNMFMLLDAIDIDEGGRLFHPDEATDIKDLAVGKRIRCHYSASDNAVGSFSGLGRETSDFIPAASSNAPNGDFYWLMFEDWNGVKRLAADRNIQHSISWNTLNSAGIASGSGISLTEWTEDLCTGGSALSSANYSTAYLPENAFNDSFATNGWAPPGASTTVNNQWIAYKFSQPQQIRRIGIKNKVSVALPSAVIEASNDGSLWTSISSITYNNATTFTYYDLPESAEYLYWRVRATANGTSTAYAWQIDEIEMLKPLPKREDAELTVRLLTGGTAAADKDNEWDQYIAGSSLNGMITPGDNIVWNWSGIVSFTSTSDSTTPANKTTRGNGSVTTRGSINTTAANGSYGFRPVLEIESLAFLKTLILHGGAYKKHTQYDALKPIQPVNQFKFDEASGNATDSRSNTIGTVTGATRVTGWNGQGSALSFPDANSYVSFPTPVLSTGKKSIRFKIKCLPNTLLSYFIANVRNSNSTYKGEMIYLATDGTLGYGYWDGTALVNKIATPVSIADNNWHDILFTWDGTTNADGLKLYVDDMSNPVARVAASTASLSATSNLYLGTQQDGIGTAGRNLNGQLDELEIYDDAITYKEDQWATVSTGLPAEAVFQSDGMNALTLLARQVKLAEAKALADSGVLGAGKVFKGIVDLSKYIDLRKLNVK